MCNSAALRRKKGYCVILVDAQRKRSHTYTYVCLYDKEGIADKYSGRFLEQIKMHKITLKAETNLTT